MNRAFVRRRRLRFARCNRIVFLRLRFVQIKQKLTLFKIALVSLMLCGKRKRFTDDLNKSLKFIKQGNMHTEICFYSSLMNKLRSIENMYRM